MRDVSTEVGELCVKTDYVTEKRRGRTLPGLSHQTRPEGRLGTLSGTKREEAKNLL